MGFKDEFGEVQTDVDAMQGAFTSYSDQAGEVTRIITSARTPMEAAARLLKRAIQTLEAADGTLGEAKDANGRVGAFSDNKATEIGQLEGRVAQIIQDEDLQHDAAGDVLTGLSAMHEKADAATLGTGRVGDAIKNDRELAGHIVTELGKAISAITQLTRNVDEAAGIADGVKDGLAGVATTAGAVSTSIDELKAI